MRIVVTGVHSTPAFAVIDELLLRKNYEIYYLGQKHSILFDKNISAEYKVSQTKDIKFIDFTAGKLSRDLSFSGLLWWARVPLGYLNALYILLKIRPKLILTFGSHVGVPIATIGALLGIPVIAHEQTITIGKATKAIQRFATKICVSWKQSQENIKFKDKYVFTGNPIRKEVFQHMIEIPFTDKSKKTIFFFCGNQGAHVINESALTAIEELTEKYNVVIQSGHSTITNDYEKLKTIGQKINNNKTALIVKDYIFPDEVGSYYANADLIVGRSGANNIAEIAALGKIALLIPIPNSSNNETYLNAMLLKDTGTAEIFEQKDLNAQTLLEGIDSMMQNIDKYKEHIEKEKLLVDLNASANIANIVEKYLAI